MRRLFARELRFDLRKPLGRASFVFTRFAGKTQLPDEVVRDVA